MQLYVWEYECECGHEFTDLDLDEFQYGDLILRSFSNEKRLVSIANKTMDEISKLVRCYEDINCRDVIAQSDFVQDVFGITCDRASDGSTFEINRLPACPKCGSRELENYGQAQPTKAVETVIPDVTHEYWNSLSMEEKKLLVDDTLLSLLRKSKISDES